MKRYFLSFAKVDWVFGLIAGLIIVYLPSRPGKDQVDFPESLVLVLVAGVLPWLLISWYMAWLASQRKPLVRLEDATGLLSWRYVDLAAPCNAVFDGCLDALRSLWDIEPTAQDRAGGVIVGEIPPMWTTDLLTTGTEVNLRVECLGDSLTSVQVLCRPLIPSTEDNMLVDFGVNRRNLNKAADTTIDALKARFPVVAG
jgi:hypothetical protein